jgi:hypothetical protein
MVYRSNITEDEYRIGRLASPHFKKCLFYADSLLGRCVHSLHCTCMQYIEETKLFSHVKRVGMGLLEYKAMPSLRDVAHDGVLCTFSNIQPQTGASGVIRQGRRHGPSITYKITPCWVTLLQPARRAAVLGQPSSLRPYWSHINH